MTDYLALLEEDQFESNQADETKQENQQPQPSTTPTSQPQNVTLPLQPIQSTKTLEALPQDLHALVRAASSGVLPKGTAKLETGLVTDLERYVMAYACQILTGDRQHALENLYAARRFWQGSRLN
jgi:hypothetical protein